jgi:hypothetical protein
VYHRGIVRGSAVRGASALVLAVAGLFGLAATRQYLDNIVVYTHLVS